VPAKPALIEIQMKNKESELRVITKAKDLTSYIMTVTQNSPKQFRFTFVSRLHNVSLDVLEELILANEVFFSKDDPVGIRERLSYQRKAISSLRLRLKVMGDFVLTKAKD